ncbi:MAG: tetratricopeptide repeat protein [Pseudorhodoplanes sp.]|nr:tetratricopeptide repeat protein [Pseudorhodoplanes sp.]
MWLEERPRILIPLTMAFFCLGADLAASQTAPRLNDCRQGYLNLLDNLHLFNKALVAACNQLIRTGGESGRGLAAGYFNRSIALIINTWPAHEQSKVAPALIDLDQAMRLDPNEGLLFTARGYLRHARADFDRAIVDYSEALRLSLPRNFVLLTRSLRGNAYMGKREYDRAIADYDEAMKLLLADPADKSYAGAKVATGNVQISRGWAWLMKENTDHALADFNDHIRKGDWFVDRAPAAFYGRSLARLRKGDRAGAERDMVIALALAPDMIKALERGPRRSSDSSVLDIGIKVTLRPSASTAQYASNWNICRSYSFGDSTKMAIAACSRVISSKREQGRSLAHAYSKRAYHRKSNEEFDGAIADYTEAIRFDSRNTADYLDDRAEVWLEAKTFDRAITDYTEAIRLDPKDAQRYISRARAWLRADDLDRAISDINEAIRIDPKNAADHFDTRADVWLNANQIDRAIADYTEAIRLDPENAPRYRTRAHAWLRTNNLNRAISDISEAIRVDPGSAYHFEARADAWLDAKQFDRAITDYTEAISLDPEEAPRYIARARGWLKAGNLDRAISDFSEAIRIDPKDAVNYEERGKALLRKDNIDGSLADFETALQLEPARTESLYGRGLAKARKGDKAGADTDIKAAKTRRPYIVRQFADEGLQ